MRQRKSIPRMLQVRNGYAYLNDKPGIGVDFDEKSCGKISGNRYGFRLALQPSGRWNAKTIVI